jgi:hypothetical protein
LISGHHHRGRPGASQWLWIIVIAAAALWVIARALPLTCSTSFQGCRTCQGRGGYRSFEWENGEPLFGDDNRGNK